MRFVSRSAQRSRKRVCHAVRSRADPVRFGDWSAEVPFGCALNLGTRRNRVRTRCESVHDRSGYVWSGKANWRNQSAFRWTVLPTASPEGQVTSKSSPSLAQGPVGRAGPWRRGFFVSGELGCDRGPPSSAAFQPLWNTMRRRWVDTGGAGSRDVGPKDYCSSKVDRLLNRHRLTPMTHCCAPTMAMCRTKAHMHHLPIGSVAMAIMRG